MPVLKYYVVEQRRSVQVRAVSIEDALKIAGVAFKNGQHNDNSPILGEEDVDLLNGTGRPIEKIEITHMSAKIV